MRINFRILKLTFICFAMISFLSCKKEEGEGGKASIQGSVWAKKYNAIGTVMMGEYAAAYEDVYIMYGDDVSYGSRIETNFDGKYEFKYLRPGKYKVYAYSKDSLGDYSKPKFAVIKEVEITKKKEVVDAGTIEIFTYQQ